MPALAAAVTPIMKLLVVVETFSGSFIIRLVRLMDETFMSRSAV